MSPVLWIYLIVSVLTIPSSIRWALQQESAADEVSGAALVGIIFGCSILSFGGVGVWALFVRLVCFMDTWNQKRPKYRATSRHKMYAKVFNRLGGLK